MTDRSASVPTRLDIDWVNTLFLIITPLVALIGVPLHALTVGFSWPIVALCAFYLVATGLSITAGYHRLFAHRSYDAHPLVRMFFLIFGAAACQNSALKWVSDHRTHHLYVDQERDPYNIKRGFFYAHMGWIFFNDRRPVTNVSDLLKDALIRWQDRFYIPLAIGVGGVVPLLFGVAMGDGWGAFLLAGVARTVIVHHSTFLINSLCHYVGRQPYSLEESARDSGWVALLTYGEGYHNFHHRFQYDYRNGIKWYHWDPTKWTIRTLAFLGLAARLRTAPDTHIFKAQLAVQRAQARASLQQRSREFRDAMEHRLHLAHEALVAARMRWQKIKLEYRMATRSMDERRRVLAATLKSEVEAARAHFYRAQASWSLLLQTATA